MLTTVGQSKFFALGVKEADGIDLCRAPDASFNRESVVASREVPDHES
jgi:hypothetical protein